LTLMDILKLKPRGESGDIATDWNALESCSSKGLAEFCLWTRQWHGLCITICVPHNRWRLEIS
jgi:hypothetical protein